jgi:hypothetical protein
MTSLFRSTTDSLANIGGNRGWQLCVYLEASRARGEKQRCAPLRLKGGKHVR